MDHAEVAIMGGVTADNLADIWLEWQMIEDGGAGWDSCTLIAKMMQYGGNIPRSGKVGQADAAMIDAAGRVRRRPRLLSLAELLISSLGERERLALLASRFYDQRRDDAGRRYTEAKIAGAVGLTVDQYRYSRKTARAVIGRLLAIQRGQPQDVKTGA